MRGVYMTWLIYEGIDRSGKSTVAEIYKKKGYEVVHLSSPDKKYKHPGYSGPSYLDDMLDMIMQYDGKDVIWDRSWYGEVVWPAVYGREPLLNDDDLDILREFEERNNTERVLMIDPDVASHWKRCFDNKEPLTLSQFKVASAVYTKMAHKHGFIPKQLRDFVDVKTEDAKQVSTVDKQEDTSIKNREAQTFATVASDTLLSKVSLSETDTELNKLEKANAIRDIIDKRILKQKGGAFDKLEEDIRLFLKTQLSNIFKDQSAKVSLSEDEIVILRAFCQRIKEKEKEGKKQ